VHERQQHFVLPTFVHFWQKSWADESERPLIENRYSPFRPEAVARRRKQTLKSACRIRNDSQHVALQGETANFVANSHAHT